MSSKPSAILPHAEERIECRRIDPPHPSVIAVDALLQQCDLRTQRRSGPGGQHRNKTSSGAFLAHRPTGVVGEATERRSQAQNRDVAVQRLRLMLAIQVRTESPLDPKIEHVCDVEHHLRQRYRGHSMKLSDSNVDKPAVLAMVLNDLHVAGGQPSLVSDLWSVSTSKLMLLIRSHPPALGRVNQIRDHHNRLPLH